MASFFEDPTWSMTEAEKACAYQAVQARAAAAAKEAKKKGAGGPRTPEGKAISAQNARKHGFAAVNPVIENIEEQEAWDAHLASYIERFQPADQVESDTVRRAALAMWKIDRISAIEAALFDLEFFYHLTMSDARLAHDIDPINRMAISFRESAGDGVFDLCRRYLHSANREHDHAIRTFYLLESKRKSAVAEAAPRIAATVDPPPTESAAATTATVSQTKIARQPNELPRKPVSSSPVVPFQPNSESSLTPEPSTQPQKPSKTA